MPSDIDAIMSEYDNGFDEMLEDAMGVHTAVALMEKDKIMETEGGDGQPVCAEGASFIDDSSPEPGETPKGRQSQGSLQGHASSILTVLMPFLPRPVVLEVINLKTSTIVISKVVSPVRAKPGQTRVIRFRVRPGTHMARIVSIKKSLKFLLQARAGRIDLR